MIGKKFSHSLISFEIRACTSITDVGIIDFCENISGLKKLRDAEPADDYQRYKNFHRHQTLSNLEHLNLGDLKQLTNRALKSIAFNLFPKLVDLSIVSILSLNKIQYSGDAIELTTKDFWSSAHVMEQRTSGE